MSRLISTETDAQTAPSQRELLGLVLQRASGAGAGFADALAAVAPGTAEEPRQLARELLTDLSIRGWIEFRAVGPDGTDVPIPRIRNEAQFIDPRNWEPGDTGASRTRYVLTEKGRAQLGRLLATPQ